MTLTYDDAGDERHRTSTDRRKIFISYRRSDSQPWAGRLAGELRRYFEHDRVYRDIDSNRPAADYARLIDEALAESRVVIAMVGPQWLACAGRNGSRRLDDPDDLVRLEIEHSLASGIAIAPVFVGGAAMPDAGELPHSLRSLSRLHGQRLSDEDWRYDFGRLLETLQKHGVLPLVNETGEGDEQTFTTTVKQTLTGVRRYERSMQAIRRRAYDAVVGAVELLRYPRSEEDPEAAQVCFTASARAVTAKVVDAGPGRCQVVVEFTSMKSSVLAGGALAAMAIAPMLLPIAAAGGVALRAMDRRFAVGFLDNVQRVLEGKGVGEDSALPPGLERWRNRSREV